MTPISPKDRPKVIAMAVVLVLVLGFVLKNVLSLVGGPKPPDPGPNVAPAPAVAVPTPTAGGPVPGTGPGPGPVATKAIESEGPVNPFRRVLPESASAPANRPPGVPSTSGGGGGGGSVPPAGLSGGFVTPGEVAPAAIVEPPIRLGGIVIDSDRFAVIASDNGTDLYRTGALVLGLFRVLRITPQEVFFRGPRGTFSLAVGESHGTLAPTPTAEKSAPTPTPKGQALPLPGFFPSGG